MGKLMMARSSSSQQVVRVKREKLAACMTCPICNKLLNYATTISDCLHSFCRKCIYNKITDDEIDFCPVCNLDLGCTSLEKLRADHNLDSLRAKVFPLSRSKAVLDDVAPPIRLPARRKERPLSSLVVSTPRVSSQTEKRTKYAGRKVLGSKDSAFLIEEPYKKVEDHPESWVSPEILNKLTQSREPPKGHPHKSINIIIMDESTDDEEEVPPKPSEPLQRTTAKKRRGANKKAPASKKSKKETSGLLEGVEPVPGARLAFNRIKDVNLKDLPILELDDESEEDVEEVPVVQPPLKVNTGAASGKATRYFRKSSGPHSPEVRGLFGGSTPLENAPLAFATPEDIEIRDVPIMVDPVSLKTFEEQPKQDQLRQHAHATMSCYAMYQVALHQVAVAEEKLAEEQSRTSNAQDELKRLRQSMQEDEQVWNSTKDLMSRQKADLEVEKTELQLILGEKNMEVLSFRAALEQQKELNARVYQKKERAVARAVEDYKQSQGFKDEVLSQASIFCEDGFFLAVRRLKAANPELDITDFTSAAPHLIRDNTAEEEAVNLQALAKAVAPEELAADPGQDQTSEPTQAASEPAPAQEPTEVVDLAEDTDLDQAAAADHEEQVNQEDPLDDLLEEPYMPVLQPGETAP